MWCPSCATAIAQAELEDREEESSFVYVQFETTDGEKITPILGGITKKDEDKEANS